MAYSVEESSPIITVTLTPAVDVTIPVSKLTPGSLHRLPSLRQDPGGKGINVSKALRAFGEPTLATGFLGGDRGHWIQTKLDELKIPHDFVNIATETRMNVKVSEEDGRLTEFNSVSPSATSSQWNELENKILAAKPGQWIAFCGRLPDGTDTAWYKQAITKARKIGARTLLDSSGEGFRAGLEGQPDVVKPNRAELSHLMGRRLDTVEEIVEAAQWLLRKGIPTVTVSLGNEGLIAVQEGHVYHVSVPRVDANSSVGAGDTLVAGLLYGIHHGLPFKACIQFAAAAGSAAVTTQGTQSPALRDVEALVPRVLVQELAN